MCGNTLEDFARREIKQHDHEDDDVDLLDVEGMSLDSRGRSTRRAAERRKMEYDPHEDAHRER